jgi:hypothetical protein
LDVDPPGVSPGGANSLPLTLSRRRTMAKKKKETKAKKEEATVLEWVDPLVNCNDVGLMMLRERMTYLFEASSYTGDAEEAASSLLTVYRGDGDVDGGELDTVWGPYEFDFDLINRFTLELSCLAPRIQAHLITLLHTVEQRREFESEKRRLDHRTEVWALEDKIQKLEKKIDELEKKGGSK